jgi:hypothetical protein
MYAIIDLDSELLIDRSQVQSPHLRLLLTILGEEMVQGSPWVAVNKQAACRWNVLNYFLLPQKPVAA